MRTDTHHTLHARGAEGDTSGVRALVRAVSIAGAWMCAMAWSVAVWAQSPPEPPTGAAGTDAPPQATSAAWYDGMVEGNFVVVSLLVGVVLIVGSLYLIRRVVPAR